MHDTKSTAKDIFVYLGIFITLIVSVYHIIKIVFSAIDIKWKDLATIAYNYDIYNDSVRFSVASLLVLYPLYVVFSWMASKDVANNPAKRELRLRKIFVYGALFITACTLAGTLISIIYTFLGGDLSIRFGLKALFIIALSAVIGGYYYYVIKRNYVQKSHVPTVLASVVSLLVLGLVIWSISIIGTPSQVRKTKLDNTRLDHLSNIQQQVLYIFNSKGALPLTIAELHNPLGGYSVPVDPVTGASYEYRVIDQGKMVMDYTTKTKKLTSPAKFELCATFETKRAYNTNGVQVGSTLPVASPSGIPAGIGGVTLGATDAMYSVNNIYYDASPFWNHEAEHTCFTRIISSEMYYGGKGL